MKNLKILLAILTTALILTLTFASCGGGGGSGNGDKPTPPAPPVPTSTVYESTDTYDNVYILEITNSASRSVRAAYDPKEGDSYILTIIFKAGDIKTSKGTVEDIKNGVKLKPNNSEETFIVTTSKEKMTAITGTIAVIEGEPVTAPEGTLTPTIPKTNNVYLLANDWENEGGSGQNWYSGGDFKYKDFTKIIPKSGWKIKLRIRGTVDKQLNWFTIGLNSHTDWKDYKWYGESDKVKIPTSFETDIVIVIQDDQVPSSEVYDDLYLEMSNILWSKPTDGDYWFNSGTSLSNKEPNGTLMATISNLEIRFVGIEQ